MCTNPPDMEKPTQFQAAKTPVFNNQAAPTTKTGRAGTILTSRPNAAAMDYAPGGKKTLLGT